MDVMSPIGLDEIGKPARATNARNGGDLLLPELASFDQFEIEGKHRKVTTAWTPRGVVGGDFLFGERFSFRGNRRGGCS